MEVATPAQAEYLAMEMELLEAGAGQRKVRAVTTISTSGSEDHYEKPSSSSLLLSDLIVYTYT